MNAKTEAHVFHCHGAYFSRDNCSKKAHFFQSFLRIFVVKYAKIHQYIYLGRYQHE